MNAQPGLWTENQKQAMVSPPNKDGYLAGPSDFTDVGQKFYARGTTAEDAAFFLPKADAMHILNKEVAEGDPHKMLAALSLVAVRGAQQSMKNQALAPKEERQEYRNRIGSVKQINALARILRPRDGEVGVSRNFSLAEKEAADQKRVFTIGGHADSAGDTNVTFLEKIRVGDTTEDRPVGTIKGIGEDGKLLVETPEYTMWLANRTEDTPLNHQPRQYMDASSKDYQTIIQVCDGIQSQITEGDLSIVAAAVGIRRKAA